MATGFHTLTVLLLLVPVSFAWAISLDRVVAPPQVQLLPRPDAAARSTWVSALQMRNGDVLLIVRDVLELAMINNQLHLFAKQNLYYYYQATGTALFLTYLVPGHAPEGLAWQYVHTRSGMELDGEAVLIHTATCVLRLWLKAPDFALSPRISIAAGHCHETALPRDGPPTFARFTQIQHVATGCDGPAVCGMLVLDASGHRLALLHAGRVRSVLLPAPAVAISLLGPTSMAAVAWGAGGFSLLVVLPSPTPSLASRSPLYAADQRWLALALLDAHHVFALGEDGALFRFSFVASDAVAAVPLGTTHFAPVRGHPAQLALDFPYGLMLLDLVGQAFALAPNLGCLCPPGFAALGQIATTGCQPAPAGGYVDVLGRFVPCQRGTFGTLSLATAQQTCMPCPPLTISNQSQATRCNLCSANTLPDPLRIECVRSCPEGTRTTRGVEGCRACPVRGQTFDDRAGACIQCPLGTYTDPELGIYTCTACPGPSPPCPTPPLPSAPDDVVVASIAMLGVRPVDMAVARTNGTIYVAAFRVLISVGHSGTALEVNLPDFALVRGIALAPDNEAVLYAAVTRASLLCIAFADSPRLLRRWYHAPKVLDAAAVLIGVRFFSSALVMWDATSNSLLLSEADDRNGHVVPPQNGSVIVAFATDARFLYVMHRRFLEPLTTAITATTPTGETLRLMTLGSASWNPYMAVWGGRLVLSSHNAIWDGVTLWGVHNLTGRVNADRPSDARFTRPGPMAEAPNSDMLLVADQLGLHVLFRSNRTCPESFYYYSTPDMCAPCPSGWISQLGAQTCTACPHRGQYAHPRDGACVPCPRIRWWLETLPCSPVVDTMVGADASGLSLTDIIMGELLFGDQELSGLALMQVRDYVSLQTLVLPPPMDAILLDAAVNTRFWTRSPRITRPPHVFVGGELLRPELVLPGFWVACSQYVLQMEPCVCQLPTGGILLGNSDTSTLWNLARSEAAAIDFGTLLLPDHSQKSPNFSPTSALFVARIDAGGGTDDVQPNLRFLEAVDAELRITVQPTTTAATPSQSAFATCVAGWPATYRCPPGFLWAAPFFACVPCKPGFHFWAGAPKHDQALSPSTHARCVPCPRGTFSPAPASTTCSPCATANASAQSACSNVSLPASSSAACPAGSERRLLLGAPACVPCDPGHSKPIASDSAFCVPCAPGQYADAPGKTACVHCLSPLVSVQWGASACTHCPSGSMPRRTNPNHGQAPLCVPCDPRREFFASGVCVNRTVFQCNAGFFLDQGAGFSDNQCRPCLPCAQGALMVPFLASPCSTPTSAPGAPYRCVPLRSIPGQFSRLSVSMLDSSAFDVQYTPCQSLPPFASWAEGPSPAHCFFQCSYAVAGPVRRQYLFYYSMERQDAQTQDALRNLQPNVYPLDYPGLAVDLMLLAARLCLPCSNAPCPLGKWRPQVEGCGPPTCNTLLCPVMEPRADDTMSGSMGYEAYDDGCVSNCSVPPNAYIIAQAPIGHGDACPWQCMFGFYLERVVVTVRPNENRTNDVCLPCSPAACHAGIEEYHVAACVPTSRRSDFCRPCPSSVFAIPVPSMRPGECEFACQPNISFRSSVDQQCYPCPTNTVTCPAGFSVVCATQPCQACPPLPVSLWSSAMAMPSSTAQCRVACRSGFHTLDAATRAVLLPPAFSYDVGTILCAPCAQRPTLPCPARTCPIGFFMPVPGSGLCMRCPTDHDCGLGQFPSGCICTQCPAVPVNYMPILASQASMLLQLHANYSVSIRCAMVCTWNTMLLAGCVPCSTFNTPALTFYAVWNASNGTRWWSAALDPPHLPPRSASLASERRAGLCWPCPPGTITSNGDADLCLSPAPAPVTNQLTFVSSDLAVLTSDNVLPASLFTATRRKLLQLSGSSRQQRPMAQRLCPAFASGDHPNCRCNPGFIMHQDACVFEQRCSAQHRLALAPHDTASASLRLVKHPLPTCQPHETRDPQHAHCVARQGTRAGLADMLRAQTACGPGHFFDASAALCVPCPRGTYSAYHGLGPCLACPRDMTTHAERSLLRTQCVVPLEADTPFALQDVGRALQ